MATQQNQTEDDQLSLGRVEEVSIVKEMERSYLDYAMSVIVSRALPDVRDGLKPVQRRIVYAMYKSGFTHSHRYEKSAATVGEVLKNYHPHGDIPVYDAMVRMAQHFSMRYPLIDGQGNFGSIDGDSPAAMRYTEARLSKISDELLSDIEKNTVNFAPNYSNTTEEPTVLPAVFPQLLLNGATGIAVGMATNIPPHNLNEVVDAVLHVIDHLNENLKKRKEDLTKVTELVVPEIAGKGFSEESLTSEQTRENLHTLSKYFESQVTTDELMDYIKGPDFPTGGAIYDIEEIAQAYATGRGRVVMRAIAKIEEVKGGKYAIIVNELPYQVNKATLIARIADLHKEKKLDGISALADESDRDGIRVYIELKRDANPQLILNNLYKLTAMQTTFNVNIVALSDAGVPQVMNLKMVIEYFIKHRFVVVTKKIWYELEEARARAHILEGLLIAVDHIDEVIKIIRSSEDADVARGRLMERFKLSEIQATAILDMQLRRLAALERKKLEDEYALLKNTMEYLTDLLAHPNKILTTIRKELQKIKETYGDARRTKVFKNKPGEFSTEDLIANEPTIVTVTQSGYIKRQGYDAFRMQQRGGRGVIGITTKEEDVVSHVFSCETHDNLMFFTSLGRVYQVRVFDVPESTRTAKGTALVNLIPINQGEMVTAVLSVKKNYKGGSIAIVEGTEQTVEDQSLQQKQSAQYLLMGTKHGMVKKTSLVEFEGIRKSGIIAINLLEGDELRYVKPTRGTDEILLVTQEGMSIRFSEIEVRPTARDTTGVRGIKLREGDCLVGMLVNSPNAALSVLTVAQRGLGKMTKIEDWPLQLRGGQGVKAAAVSSKSGKLVSAIAVRDVHEHLILTTNKGTLIKLSLKDVPLLGRQTQGVILMRMGDGASESIAAATVLVKPE